jgi:RsiW-degrading membrane proteinase PrsW (M82 family)
MIETLAVFTAIIFGACLPSIIWLLFFVREEPHPVPSRFLIYTFGAGAISSLFVLVAQFFFQEYAFGGMRTGLSLFSLAFIEETFKFTAAFFAVYKTHELVRHEDAMLLAITASLGFASVENIFALAASADAFNFYSLYSLGYIILVRFLGATMLHALAAGIIGYYWARGIFHGKLFKNIAIGVLLATLVHGVFNHLIIRFQNDNLLVYPALFLAFILFFVLVDFDALKKEDVLEREARSDVI